MSIKFLENIVCYLLDLKILIVGSKKNWQQITLQALPLRPHLQSTPLYMDSHFVQNPDVLSHVHPKSPRLLVKMKYKYLLSNVNPGAVSKWCQLTKGSKLILRALEIFL